MSVRATFRTLENKYHNNRAQRGRHPRAGAEEQGRAAFDDGVGAGNAVHAHGGDVEVRVVVRGAVPDDVVVVADAGAGLREHGCRAGRICARAGQSASSVRGRGRESAYRRTA